MKGTKAPQQPTPHFHFPPSTICIPMFQYMSGQRQLKGKGGVAFVVLSSNARAIIDFGST